MISVIISTYNRPERLGKAIQSVLDQTYQDFEIIVVDDGSTEDIGALLSSYREVLEGKIRFYRFDQNFGNDTKPKNTGILASKGEYIAFLDDDCEYRPDHLQALYNELSKHPEVSLVYGDRWLVDETEKIPGQIGVYYDFNPSLLLQRNYIDTSDVLVRREALFKVGGWDERYKKYVDWNLFLRMTKAGMKLQRVPLVLTDYHLHDDMKSVKVQTDKEKGKNAFIPEWDPFDVEIELPYLGEINDPRMAVYTMTYERLEYTKKSFASLWEKAGYEFEHFVLDQGSKDGTPEWLKEYEAQHPDKVHVIYSDKNLGISKASNMLVDEIKKQDFQIIMKSDNDCEYTSKGFLKTMVDIWKSNHMIAMSCYVQGLRDNPGGAQRIGYGKIQGQLVGMAKHIGGICHFVDSHAYDEFRWDTHDFLHGFQDVEFSRYLIMNGYQCAYLENWYCEHIEGTYGQEKSYPDYFERRKSEKQTRGGVNA